ncbi:hypothetical protein [Nakamurella endophytica]|uniref:Uncharacterized protein n=1 Tax=Nakamurella endophytica TaxID=1748367 RepID=A0A917WBU2_9ACTN|nr:hypothetical protein [Nakamurella endophytica]GGL90983.1 hypothetical protein GCM10011594_08320 [Nakamurella endophytica]
MSTTFATAIGMGRHRAGGPGLVPVTMLVQVRRRGWFRSLFRPARHRAVPDQVTGPLRRPAPAHAL